MVLIPIHNAATHPHSTIHRDTKFKLIPVIFKHHKVYSRWIRRVVDPASAVLTGAGSAAPPIPLTADDAMVWEYMRELMANGIKVVAQLEHEKMVHCSQSSSTARSSSSSVKVEEPPPNSMSHPVDPSLLDVIVESHLNDWTNQSEYELISIPMSVFRGEQHGVCAYRISDMAGCPNEPYQCITCTTPENTMDICRVSRQAKHKLAPSSKVDTYSHQ